MNNNKLFRQRISVIIEGKSHESCLEFAKLIKKQCEAWFFNVQMTENKSARKGEVLQREIMIKQEAYANDIIIFKESLKRICFYINSISPKSTKLVDKNISSIE